MNSLRGGIGDNIIEVGDNSSGSILRGGAGADTLISGKGWDVLNGGEDYDFIFGGGGNDRLRGGNWADYLNGGSGNDMLSGDTGADILDFVHNNNGHDVITDFQIGIDHIYLSNFT